MMDSLKSILRQCVPHGLIERHRRLFRLQRLGLRPAASESQKYETAANACRFDLWPQFLREARDWTLVDVGANEGDFIRGATLLAKPVAVIAFEPLPACQEILAPLLADVSGGQLVRAAVGSAPGEVELNCTGNTKMSSVLQPQPGIEGSYPAGDYAVVQKLKVPVVRLDDVLAPGSRIGLMKIDVQGYEMEVLRGATRALQQTQALLVEVNYAPHYEGAVGFDDVHSFLRDEGFQLHGISAPYGDESRPLWADAMYVAKKASPGKQ
jgi:FkbM family methyltransferase